MTKVSGVSQTANSKFTDPERSDETVYKKESLSIQQVSISLGSDLAKNRGLNVTYDTFVS